MQQLIFDDLLLNPSVTVEDEVRLSRQAERMLRLFIDARQQGAEVSNIELRQVALQYQARLYEIRRFLVQKGFCIDLIRRRSDGVCEYALVPLSESQFYRKHQYTM